MNIPLKWLYDYLPELLKINKSSKEIARSFTEIGLMLEKPIKNDVLELEHRMDRADWLSIIGCARDLGAFEKIPFQFPVLKSTKLEKSQEVYVEIKSEKVNRFRTRVIKNIKVGESPSFIKERLIDYGLPVINNVVDITNFVMVEMGQPLHAQDLKKFNKREIILRDTENKDGISEQIQTLDGTVIKLPDGTLVLSESGNPVCIGGIVGGLKTGVTENTTEIVLDAGNYSQSAIRKTSRKIGVFNETVLRSEKFLAPEMVDLAIIRATDLILEYAGGVAYENEDMFGSNINISSFRNSDQKNFEKTPKQFVLRKSRLDKIAGESIDISDACEILKLIEYQIISKDMEKAVLLTPYFRTDIEVEDDLVADVLRVRGYSKINPEPIFSYPPREITPKMVSFTKKLRGILLSSGFHEHITDSFVKYDGLQQKGEDQRPVSRVLLRNSLNADQDALRIAIKESLSKVVENYKKHGQDSGKIFEIGKVFEKDMENGEINEFSRLGMFVFGSLSSGREKNLNEVSSNTSDLLNYESLEIRKALDLVLKNLGIINYSLIPSEKNISICIKKVNTNLDDKYTTKQEIESENNTETEDNKGLSQRIIGFFDGNYAEFYLDKILLHQKFQSFAVTQFDNLAKEDLTFSTHILTNNGEIIEFIENCHPLIHKIEYLGEYLDGFKEENKNNQEVSEKYFGKRRVSIRYFTKEASELKEIRQTIIRETVKKYQVEFIL